MFARIFATLLLALPAVTMAATSNGPVLVTGATGQTGRLLVPALIEPGHSVRALIRNPAAAGSLPTGVQSVIADVTTPATLAAAMRGVSTVISTIGARFPIGSNGFAAVDWEGNRALIDAAKSAGVSHFILGPRTPARQRRRSFSRRWAALAANTAASVRRCMPNVRSTFDM